MPTSLHSPHAARSMGFLASVRQAAADREPARPPLWTFDGGETVSFADAAHNTLVLGTTGSGKTTSAILPAADRLIAAGFGGVIIDVKGSFSPQIRQLAARHGRLEDVVELGDGPQACRVNLLADISPVRRSEVLRQLLLGMMPASENNISFHLRGLRCVTDAVELLQIMAARCRRPLSLGVLERLMNDPAYAHAFYTCYVQQHYRESNMDEMDLVRRIDGERFHFLTRDKALLTDGEWHEQINYQLGAVRTGLSLLRQCAELEAHFFAPVKENLWIAERVYRQRKIILLRLSPQCGESGAMLARIILRDYYAAVMACGAALPENAYTFCIMDEAQHFLSVDRTDPYNDNAFLALAREFRNISIVGTQSVTALMARTNDSAAVEAMLGNFNVRLFLYSDDPRTAALAAVHDPMPLTGLGPAQGLLVTYDARERRHLHGRVSVQKMHDAMQGCLEKTRQAASSEDIWLRPFARRDEKERTRRQLALEMAYLRPPQKASRPQRTQTADALRQGLPA